MRLLWRRQGSQNKGGSALTVLPTSNGITTGNNVGRRNKASLLNMNSLFRQFLASLCLLLMGAIMHSVIVEHASISDAEWRFLTHWSTSSSGSATSAVASSTSTVSTSSAASGATSTTTTKATTQAELQFDILLPLFERDDNVRAFATRLKPTLQEYAKRTSHATHRIARFRLLLTRYSQAEQDSASQLKEELAHLTALPSDQIVMVIPKNHNNNHPVFERSGACNILMENACHDQTCLVARIDVDMDLKPEFLQRAAQFVNVKNKTAYFPIVWSEYNPQSVKLVQEQLGSHELDKYSEHRGHFRIWGTGMYVLSGPDAATFRFNEDFKGWGGEDGNFYERVKAQRNIVRMEEPGLIHTWHEKNCRRGKDVFTDLQVKECHMSREGEDGSELGKDLLAKWRSAHNIQQDQ